MTKGPIRLDVAVSYAAPRGIAGGGELPPLGRGRAGRTHPRGRPRRAHRRRQRKAARSTATTAAKDYATNVLSFPADVADGVKLPKGVKLPLLGDLVLCAPVVAREARNRRSRWPRTTRT